jgi:membrane fusion protein, multidrug efflux system
MSKLAAQPSASGDVGLENRDAASAEPRAVEERTNRARITKLNRPSPNPTPVADTPNNRRRLLISGTAVLLLVVAGGTWWAAHNRAQAGADGQTKVTPPLELAQVDIDMAQPRVLARSLPLSGSIAPLVQATVKAKVGGEVQQITVFEGQDLERGAVIARIDTRNQQAQYDRELAAVEKARADLDLARLNRDKNRTLLEQRYISQNTFESTESTYTGSAASLRLAEAQARVAKNALDDSVIRAPFAGTIAKRTVQQGEKVSPDSPIVAMVDLREMLLEAAIPAADIPAVAVGQSVRFKVNGFGARQFEGKVQRINPTTAENSRSILVYIAVPNPDRALKGGMFAQGELLLAAGEPVLAVPRAALRSETGVVVVYTLANGKIVRRQVTTGVQNDDTGYVEITSGLTAGEAVIVADIRDRKPGDAAVVREAAASPAR